MQDVAFARFKEMWVVASIPEAGIKDPGGLWPQISQEKRISIECLYNVGNMCVQAARHRFGEASDCRFCKSEPHANQSRDLGEKGHLRQTDVCLPVLGKFSRA